jgi:hypothetical protein
VDDFAGGADAAGGSPVPHAQHRRLDINRAVFIAAPGVVVFSLQPLVYPHVVGGALAVDAVTTVGTTAGAYLAITAMGAVLLAVMLGLYPFMAKALPTLGYVN